MEIVDRDGILDDAVAEVVSRTVADPPLDPATGQPHRKRLHVVVAAVPLGHRRPAELRPEDDERLVEHPPPRQILDERRGAAIDLRRRPLHMLLDSAVVIPVAVIELDKTDAPLGEPPGEEAVGGERSVASLRAVELERLGCLIGEIEEPRHARLHPEGELVLREPGGDLRIVDDLVAEAVELRDRVDDRALAVEPDRRLDVQDGVSLGAKLDPLKPAGEEARMPLPRGDRLPLPVVARAHHDDEAGEILGLAAKAVPQPASCRWTAGDHRTGVHEGVGRIVVDRLGVEALYDRDPVGDPGGDLREDRADLLAALPHLVKGMLRTEALERLTLELGDLLPLREALRHRLAIHGGKLRLVVERVEVGHAAGHVEPDHPLRFRRHMVGPNHPRPARRRRDGGILRDRRGGKRPAQVPAPEQGAEGEGPKPAGGTGEEGTPARAVAREGIEGSRMKTAHGVSSS